MSLLMQGNNNTLRLRSTKIEMVNSSLNSKLEVRFIDMTPKSRHLQILAYTLIAYFLIGKYFSFFFSRSVFNDAYANKTMSLPAL